MSINLDCTCGANYHIQDDLLGQRVRCDSCGHILLVLDDTRELGGGARNHYVVKRELVSWSEKYEILDEQENQSFFRVTRPRRILYRSFLRTGMGLGGLVLYVLLLYHTIMHASFSNLVYYSLGIFLSGVIFTSLVSQIFRPKRHLWFFKENGEMDFWIWDFRRFTVPSCSFALMDRDGHILAIFKRHMGRCFFKRTWRCENEEGRLLFETREDSILRSWFRRRVMKRLFPRMVGTTMLLETGDRTENLGYFKRRLALVDTYDLRLESGLWGTMDCRMALGMCVLFSSVEAR